MSAHSGPNINETGLILCLDAANTRCFKSGETTCTNLVTGGLVTGASGTPSAGNHTPNPDNFPEYSSSYNGIFDFVNGRGMNCEEDLGQHTEFTLALWIYKDGAGSTEYITDARNDGGDWFLSNYNSYNITYTNRITYNFDTTYSSTNPEFINRWLFLVVTSDASGSNMYINNELVTSGSSLDESLGKNFRIGTRYTATEHWVGYMGVIMAFNRVISTDEINKLYQSYRSRYKV